VGDDDADSANITGNAAWGAMGTKGGTAFNGIEMLDGTAVTTEEIRDGTGLPAPLKTGPWIYTPGYLPILGGLGGQDAALPVHLK
jgi:hypothetical protein